MKQRIAILDDEPDILEVVSGYLRKSGYLVKTYEKAEEFFRHLENEMPDLLLLDLMLPDSDGLEICRMLKSNQKYSRLPVIILTAKGEEVDKVLGLELGAEDYITKPFSLKEMEARIRAVLRRQVREPEVREIEIGGKVIIRPDKYEVSVAGRTIDLTATEFKILEFLAAKPGRVFTRGQILDYLWGHDKAVLDRTVDVHIKNLRQKLGEAAFLIKNIRGVGYRIEPR